MSAGEYTRDERLTQEAADWYARLRSEAVSEVEVARFRAWIAGNPAHRREFDEVSAMWDALQGVAESPEVAAELQSLRPEAATGAEPRRLSRRAVVGWALAASAAGAAGFLTWQRLFASETYATGVGEQRTVPLADGSILTLNTASRVKVHFSGTRRRMEILAGQANFEVAKDAARPFIVSAGHGEVLALGTVFDVYRRASDTVVTLIEGRVAVVPEVPAGRSGASAELLSGGTPGAEKQAQLHALVLNAGEQVRYGAPGRAPERTHADLQRVSAWRDRKLDFAETPLAEAIAEANRYTPVKIELRAPELADARISGVFQAGRNEAVAEGFGAYFGLDVERSGEDRILLTPKTH